jgi:hypothetical protein
MEGVSRVVWCILRFLDCCGIVIFRGTNPGDDRCLCLWAFFTCAMLEAMSGCLESSVSCSGVGSGGSYWKELCSMFCHLVEICVD